MQHMFYSVRRTPVHSASMVQILRLKAGNTIELLGGVERCRTTVRPERSAPGCGAGSGAEPAGNSPGRITVGRKKRPARAPSVREFWMMKSDVMSASLLVSERWLDRRQVGTLRQQSDPSYAVDGEHDVCRLHMHCCAMVQ